MFNTYTNSVIDTVQTAKKSFVEIFGATAEVKAICNEFIDAQTKYTKEAAETGMSLSTKVTELLMDRTPYIEAAKTIQSYFPTAAVVSKSKKAK